MDTLERVEEKLDKIIEKLHSNSIELAKHGLLHQKNTEDLETHIKRTDLLEKHMEVEHLEIRQEHKELKKDLQTALLPIKAFQFLAKLCIGLTAIYGLVRLFIKL